MIIGDWVIGNWVIGDWLSMNGSQSPITQLPVSKLFPVAETVVTADGPAQSSPAQLPA